jgi:putative thymidine phosphorylase
MDFIPKRIPIKTGHRYIVVLNKKTAHKFDLHPGDRLLVRKKGSPKEPLRCLVEISDNGEFTSTQIGLFTETYKELNIKRGDRVRIEVMEKPASLTYIHKKLDGHKLNAEEINEIVKDIIEDDLTDAELTYFVSGTYVHGLDDEETANLTRSIVKNGDTLSFKDKVVIDKHCIGGVPGNRTTMVIVPIMAAAGLTMPKTSSRSITSPSGTADTMEVLCNVTINAKKLQKIIKKTKGFIAWGGGVDIASADDKLIRVRHPLSLDPEGMLLASIMGKKFAAGSTHVLIDIPYGPQAKVKSVKKAKHLKRRFEKIGKLLGMKTRVIITFADEPIGQGIGPALEAIDVMKVLNNDEDAPKDLRKKSLQMAGIMLELAGKAWKGKGYKKAKQILDSGEALKAMEAIIDAQGHNKEQVRPGKFSQDVVAPKKGTVTKINNKLVSRIARVAGAPDDKNAGIIIHKKLDQTVKKGEVLFTIYSDQKERIKQVEEQKIPNPYTIS